MPQITLASKARPNQDVVFQDLGGDAVMLNLGSESYFGLNEVGTRIWALLAEDNSLQHSYDTLLDEYSVAPERLQSDLLGLVEEMAKAGLVQIL